MENKIFSYTYSAAVQREVREIKKKYMPREDNKMDELRRLDRRVQIAGITESLTVGILGVMIFGLGMCVGLGTLGGGMMLSVLLCAIGMAVMLPAYFIYRAIADKARAKYVPQILQLADELEKIKINKTQINP